MPRCSVLIPAYNVENYVAKAVQSALDQTTSDVEVVVVNDGSTDGTAAALQPFSDRIIYIEQENRGLSAARNAALRASSGELIALLDADDAWMPQRLERMLSFMHEMGSKFATSDSYLMLADRLSGSTYYEQWSRGRRFRSSDQAYWITQYNFIHVMTVISRDLFDKHGDFDERLRACEDWELWLRFITAGERADFLDQPLGYYRIRSDSLSFNPRVSFLAQLTMLELAETKFGDRPPKGLRARSALAGAKAAMVRGDSVAARQYFAEASNAEDLPAAWKLTALGGRMAPKLATRMFARRYPAKT
ncbi:MAG TPA: glycosyltransferase family A protein [Actinomycetota bacterium]|nr:glycosyltransferase family A protein [Actinomycetota bacterium]